jgi:hypothetical protein
MHTHAPYCHTWSYNIFPHYLINGTISERKKKLLNMKHSFWFLYKFVRNNSHSMKNWARWSKTYTGLRVKYTFYLSDFSETPSTGNRVALCGHTDRRDEAKSLFALLRTRLKPLRTVHKYNDLTTWGDLKVAGSIPAGVTGFFTDIKSFRSHYGAGVDSASNRNEYQEYFLGVKTAGA